MGGGELPIIICAPHYVFPERLFEPRVVEISLARLRRNCTAARTSQSADACRTGNKEILVVGSHNGSGIANAEHGSRFLYVVCYGNARFRFRSAAEAAIQVSADAQIDRPIPERNRILNVE